MTLHLATYPIGNAGDWRRVFYKRRATLQKHILTRPLQPRATAPSSIDWPGVLRDAAQLEGRWTFCEEENVLAPVYFITIA